MKLYNVFITPRTSYTRLIKYHIPNFLRWILPTKRLGLVYFPRNVQIFTPFSAGSDKLISNLAILAANQTIPFLEEFYKKLMGYDDISVQSVTEFRDAIDIGKIQSADTDLKQKFDEYGSDKGQMHEYHLIYAAIFESKKNIRGVLEIGLGTNNEKIASNMSAKGKPGASLRAFRDFLPNALIYGADFDKNILFEEERIKTYFVDQTSPDTFDNLLSKVSNPIDVIIDDGLHSPNANIATLTFALSKLKMEKNVWIVVEDIREEALPVWKLVAHILPSASYNSFIIKTKISFVFACHKL